jgi:hypothetical protein
MDSQFNDLNKGKPTITIAQVKNKSIWIGKQLIFNTIAYSLTSATSLL